MTPSAPITRATEIKDRRTRSEKWLESNYYEEWAQAFQSYKCERDAEKDADGNEDSSQTSIGLPDTWATVRRTVARNTAQIPNLRFHAKDADIGELISRTLMYQWDRGGTQRIQKRHFLQAAVFGWSVKAWYWDRDSYRRTKRIDIMDPALDPQSIGAVAEQYRIDPMALMDPARGLQTRAQLLSQAGRGKLLPVKYDYVAYEGPKCDFVSIVDCFPEPNFQTLQSSNWFIVQRRRNKEWIERTAKRFPEFAQGFDDLMTKFPKGTEYRRIGRQTETLRQTLIAKINRTDDLLTGLNMERGPAEWTITEQHTPGQNPRLAYVGEDDVWIGEIEYPYDLDGKIAFTELTLIDDLLAGIGDSTARIIRGLQQLHDRQVMKRVDLIDNIQRPLIGTTNREFYENAEQHLKRHKGFRLVLMRGPNDLWVQPEMAAIAAAAAGLQDEQAIMRMYQMATGENNMSSMANVDPQQNRTATGARLMAFNQDILTKDQIDMGNYSVKADAEMMFMLNRSEASDEFEFDSNRYNRTYSATTDMTRENWQKVEPAMFQLDGEITAEVGSTLADDDEAKVAKATNLFIMLGQRPDVNQQKLRDDLLIAHGKGRELAQFAVPPPPPPPPEVRTNISVAVKAELMPTPVQMAIGGVVAQNLGLPPEQGMPAPGGMPTPPSQAVPQGPLQEMAGEGALAAAIGRPQ